MCSEGAELAGLPTAAGRGDGGGRVPRDVHAKCGELLAVLLARGAPLHSLYKVMERPPSRRQHMRSLKEPRGGNQTKVLYLSSYVHCLYIH